MCVCVSGLKPGQAIWVYIGSTDWVNLVYKISMSDPDSPLDHVC